MEYVCTIYCTFKTEIFDLKEHNIPRVQNVLTHCQCCCLFVWFADLGKKYFVFSFIFA